MIKWIELKCDVFDLDNIKKIELLPESDSILATWYKIICIFIINNSGLINLMNKIPFNDLLLSELINKPLEDISLILLNLQNAGLIKIKCNTSKNKNTTKLDYARDQNTSEKVKTKKEVKKGYGEFSNVLLSDDEYEKLIVKLGKTNTDEFINRVSLYIESKGDKYKSHYATLLSWYRNGASKPGGKETSLDIKALNELTENYIPNFESED